MPIEPDIGGYLESWSAELKARQDRVRLLIGNAHWLSDGHHKEAIVREFLIRYLPRFLLITRGFIRPPRLMDGCSPELDIIIADPARHPAFFDEGGLAIVPPSAVLAYFEIKTRFSRSTLRRALETIAEAQAAVGTAADAQAVWRGLVFFDADEEETQTSAAAMVADELAKVPPIVSVADPNRAATGHCLAMPVCIVVIARFVGFVRASEQSGYSTLRWFETRDLSLACSLADMFSVISTRLSGTHVGELDQMIESIATPKPSILSIPHGRTDGE